MNDIRPDPDALLAEVQAQEQATTRGRLRIYLGAAAGVGKTFAMLSAAHVLQRSGQRVLVGIVETHERPETAALLKELEVLPRRQLIYRQRKFEEFDLDGALAAHPDLVLVDELAHTNMSGSRHPKRWQDVEELLKAGINVFTTVNVQHLESLNDIVNGITGINISETLPDKVFDLADEVVLVDISADELLLRLKSGKIYPPARARSAAQNFFRKGNLIALRELALRRTAERVKDDVRAYRIEKSIHTVWKTDEALLVCVAPRTDSEYLIRSAARMARQLNTEWHAIYIETSNLQSLPQEQHERILRTLKLAQELGAKTAVLSGNDVAESIVDFARNHNASRILIGRSQSILPWPASISKKIARRASDIDLIEIGNFSPGKRSVIKNTLSSGILQIEETSASMHTADRSSWHIRYLWAVIACIAITLLVKPFASWFALSNIVMLYLLTLVLVAVRLGRGPAIAAAFLNVLAFDFFFVPPIYTFVVDDLQYLVTFGVMLAVGLITGPLTARLNYQAKVAMHRENRARALYEFGRELSGALQIDQVCRMTQEGIGHTFHVRNLLLLPDENGKLQLPQTFENANTVFTEKQGLDIGIAQWAFDQALPAGMGTDTLPANPFFYLPLVAPMRTRGILVIEPRNRHWILIPEQRRQLETFVALAAISLERVHYIEVAQDALVRMESERLRNSLLATLSHDLRTPLTVLMGLSESLLQSRPALSDSQHHLAQALYEESARMNHLVTNLLQMAMLQSGDIRLHLEWNAFEEIVGAAIRNCASFSGRHVIEPRLPHNLPLVRFDPMLVERVLCNLIENATKYTPPNSHIIIAAEVTPPFLTVTVSDDGPGLPTGMEEAVFEKFTRGMPETDRSGMGLGLSICRAIIDVHGGTIQAKSGTGKGTTIQFTLPLGSPPEVPQDAADITLLEDL